MKAVRTSFPFGSFHRYAEKTVTHQCPSAGGPVHFSYLPFDPRYPWKSGVKFRDVALNTRKLPPKTKLVRKGSDDTPAKNNFPIVGVGASAGGLDAFTQ